jgi:SAM-dependent methyltransferase
MEGSLYADYDRLVVKCLPEYYSLLEIVVWAILGHYPVEIIDLGCGTGNLARIIFQSLPRVTVWGVDNSAEFLAIARDKCRGRAFRPIRADILDYDPGMSTCDCLVSSFSIHHFEDEEKLKLFRKIHRTLKPGGIFINLDMVRQRNYRQAVSNFLAKMEESGLSAEFIEAERKDMAERDRPVSLAVQKKWLKQIGFRFELIHNSGLWAAYCCQKG